MRGLTGILFILEPCENTFVFQQEMPFQHTHEYIEKGLIFYF